MTLELIGKWDTSILRTEMLFLKGKISSINWKNKIFRMIMRIFILKIECEIRKHRLTRIWIIICQRKTNVKKNNKIKQRIQWNKLQVKMNITLKNNKITTNKFKIIKTKKEITFKRSKFIWINWVIWVLRKMQMKMKFKSRKSKINKKN